MTGLGLLGSLLAVAVLPFPPGTDGFLHTKKYIDAKIIITPPNTLRITAAAMEPAAMYLVGPLVGNAVGEAVGVPTTPDEETVTPV